jgi:hypothetical protein
MTTVCNGSVRVRPLGSCAAGKETAVRGGNRRSYGRTSGERGGVRESGQPSCRVACRRGSAGGCEEGDRAGVPAFGASGTSVCAGCSGVARWGGRAGGDRDVHGAATRLGDRRRSRECGAAWRGTWGADGCSASRSSGARRSVAGWLCGLRSGTSATGSSMRGLRRPTVAAFLSVVVSRPRQMRR